MISTEWSQSNLSNADNRKHFNIHIYIVVKFVFYGTTQDLNNFDNFNFKTRSTVNQHNIRYNSQLVLSIPRNNIMLHSVFYKGLLLYNGLPDDHKSNFDKNMFKVNLKTYFFVALRLSGL